MSAQRIRRAPSKSQRPKNEKEERYYIPNELAEQLDAFCKARNQSKSDYVRRLVERQLPIDQADMRKKGEAPPTIVPTDPVERWGSEVHRKVDELLDAIRQPPARGTR